MNVMRRNCRLFQQNRPASDIDTAASMIAIRPSYGRAPPSLLAFRYLAWRIISWRRRTTGRAGIAGDRWGGQRNGKDMPIELQEYIAGQIWLCSYPVKYLGMRLYARMTVIRLDDGRLMLHSPCEIDDHLRRGLAELGEVAYIVAPWDVSLPASAFRAKRPFPKQKPSFARASKTNVLTYISTGCWEILRRPPGLVSSIRFWCAATAGFGR